MNPNFSPDSPELTAYALGELPATTRAALEAQLAVDPALQAELAALQATAQQLRTELVAEPQPELAAVQRAWIAGQLDQVGARAIATASPRSRRNFPWWWALCGGAAAAVMTGLIVRSWGPAGNGWGRPVPITLEVLAAKSAGSVATPASPEPLNEPADNGVRTITANDGLDRQVQRPAATPLDDRGTSLSTVANERSAVLSSAPLTPTAPIVPKRESTDAESSLAIAPTFSKPTAVSGPQSLSAPAQGVRNRARLATSAGSRSTGGGGAVRDPSLAYSTPDPGLASAPAPLPTAKVSGLEARSGARVESDFYRSMEPKLANRYGLGRPVPEHSTERYAPIVDNPFRTVDQAPLSTFGMDVDTASYANVRRFLREGTLPPPDAVRLEEFINYFSYELPAPKGSDPFGVVVETAACPWNSAHRLIRIGLKARDIPRGERPHANLVFLVDVSGSMEPENKLPLVKKSLRLLVEQLTPRDTVALVTYAGEAGVAMDPTTGSEKDKINQVIDRLAAGGSTHGSAGILAAYDLARKAFVKDGINRVLLCTDGDFNVGVTSQEDLLKLISEQARSGVFLSVLGYGMGNYQDATTELLADKGNGNYAYIDSFSEARKVLREQMQATFVTVAKDAKVQIEFNPGKVASWRLLGYENRVLADRDFKDDQKDAGDVGAGQSVTVLYEIVPLGPSLAAGEVLRYQRQPAAATAEQPSTKKTAGVAEFRDELLFLKLRHKLPEATTSTEWTVAVKDDDRSWSRASDDFQFSAAVAGFGMLLRHSPHGGSVSYDLIQRLAQEGLGADKEGYRAEFIDLVRRAQRLAEQK